ncbi:MAG: hypothetical protein IT214_10410 [Chitinophagaceae bacterium]|jgi:hypothetical protein|nr:hypothetical protein [Chitinophagaceae bacterium]OQY95431.1 MAG: hypothetical protein B6D37_05420 [Sphingobacteriales bacterium UTBCD1]
MRKKDRFILITLCLLHTALFSCNQPGKNSETEKPLSAANQTLPQKTADTNFPNQKTMLNAADTTEKSGLGYLKNYAGKYPYDVKLFDNPELTGRLKKLLGNRYQFFKDTWDVETPIEIKNNIFKASACEAHNCDATNFIIFVDLSTNTLYAGIKEEGQIKKYAERGSDLKELDDWASKD